MTIQRLATLDVAGKSVLELGPGPGGNLRLLRDHGAERLIGFDIAPQMVRIAQRNLGDQAEIHQFDGSRLPLADQEVDIALTVTVLQHNPEASVPGLLDELTRVTRSTLELIEDTTRFRPRSFGDTYFVRDPNQYISWVTALGFRLVEVQPMNTWASERASMAVQRVARLATRRPSEEGRAPSAAEVTLERLLLPLTRLVDRRLPPMSGLTAMRFQRL
jgi:ubiquinone/menaquinone biosynthesis C-methylase UbiE